MFHLKMSLFAHETRVDMAAHVVGVVLVAAHEGPAVVRGIACGH